MKSCVFIPILLVLLCSIAYSYAMYVEMAMKKDPRNPGMCTIDNNMILREGEVLSNPHGRCELLHCYEGGQTKTDTCMKQGMRHGCVEGEVLQPHATYPECCKRAIKCKTDYYSS